MLHINSNSEEMELASFPKK